MVLCSPPLTWHTVFTSHGLCTIIYIIFNGVCVSNGPYFHHEVYRAETNGALITHLDCDMKYSLRYPPSDPQAPPQLLPLGPDRARRDARTYISGRVCLDRTGCSEFGEKMLVSLFLTQPTVAFRSSKLGEFDWRMSRPLSVVVMWSFTQLSMMQHYF